MWISIFRNGLLVGRIFEILKKFFFVSPIVHQHVNLTMITYWRNDIFLNHFFKMLINFPHTWHQSTYQNQSVSYMSVNFTKKNHFFGSRFFKFHRHVILFHVKKEQKKVTCCDFHQKKNPKSWSGRRPGTFFSVSGRARRDPAEWPHKTMFF